MVSADTDFGTFLALRREARPSVILFRHGSERRPERQVEILRPNLDALAEDLTAGSVVIFDSARLRPYAIANRARSACATYGPPNRLT